MTVAAVILFGSADEALADSAERVAARRIVEAAWAGGATPIVVVAPDPDGRVAQALAGSPAVLAEPAPSPVGDAGQLARGARLALDQVSETDAALAWPGRMAWVDAETVTSLIERHGIERSRVLRPTYESQVGWPALLPLVALPDLVALPPALGLDELVARLAGTHGSGLFDTGDPGTVHDVSVELAQMPAYAGPPEPARPAPEWGAAAADEGDDVPLEGPALAPYGQAADPESD